MAFALRPATPDDRELLLAVYASTRAEELAVTGWPDEVKRGFLAQQFAAQDAHYRTHYAAASFEVILVDGEPAGRLYLDRRADEIRIVDIALLPAFRQAGTGTAILRSVEAEADAAGKRISIHVEHTNRARSLYARHGFEQVADQGVYLLLERQPMTAS
jgi:ribosomal protein S18 acetylase RimI-like enzyme